MAIIGQYMAVSQAEILELSQGKRLFQELNRNDYEGLDIDRSWEGVHFLLCNQSDNGNPPEGYVVPLLNDQFLNFLSFGAFYLHDEQVREAATYLNALTPEELRKKYTSETFVKEKIYPLFSEEDIEGLWEYLKMNLDNIAAFYRKAASQGQGIIFYLI